jgi:hypothetical protein
MQPNNTGDQHASPLATHHHHHVPLAQDTPTRLSHQHQHSHLPDHIRLYISASRRSALAQAVPRQVAVLLLPGLVVDLGEQQPQHTLAVAPPQV